jgi:short-subunit dehydrogenase
MSESVPIVTGASQGIGRATAIRPARDFSAIILVARNFQNLKETATHIKSAGAEPLRLDLDLSRPTSVHPSEAPLTVEAVAPPDMVATENIWLLGASAAVVTNATASAD